MVMLMFQLRHLLARFVDDEKAQGLVEYGLIIGLVAIALVAGLGLLTGSLQSIFSAITSSLNKAANPGG